MAGKVQSINSLRNLVNYRAMLNPKAVSDAIVDSLAKEGKRIIELAYSRKDWKNQTYNLYNSYVAGVFVGKKLVRVEYLYDNQEQKPERTTLSASKHMTDIPYGSVDIESGRKEAENFLASYGAQSSGRGIKLVVAAAMYYAAFLEKKNYHVLASIRTELDDVARDGMFVVDSKIGGHFEYYLPSKYIAVREDESIDYGTSQKKLFTI